MESTDPVDGKNESEALHEWKARFVHQLRPDLFFEDMPEFVAQIAPSILVFMPCAEVIHEWITGHLNAKKLACVPATSGKQGRWAVTRSEW